MPSSDGINRERYTNRSADNGDDDDVDYELEPIDHEIVAAERRRADEAIAESQTAIDVDQIYRDLDDRQDGGVLGDWLRGFRGGFHFQVKHLLIATAVVAIALTLWKLGQLGRSVTLATVSGIIGLYLYSQWKESQMRAEADRRRDAMYARRRAYFDKPRTPGAPVAGEVTTAVGTSASKSQPSSAVDDEFHEAMAKPKFRFQFSLKQLMTLMFVSAFMMGLIQYFGGPAPTATMLGVIALGGLIIHAIGYEPPEVVVLGWWLLLVLYVLLTFVGFFWSGA